MERFDISAANVAEHLLITWIPWLIGIVVGGGLGALCALGIRAIFRAMPALHRPSVLLPWRTLLMGLLLAACSPFVVSLLGLGPTAGGVMVGSSVCLLAAAFAATTLVEHGHPSPLAAQLIGGGRTLAIASGLIAVGVGLLGGGGLGPITLEAARLQQYGLMWKGLLLILALALALDLILGLAQMIALTYSGDSGRPVTAGG